MINRRTFLKLTAAASAALLGLKPKAKPERVVGTAGKIEVERMSSGKRCHIHFPHPPLTQEMLDDVCFLPLYDVP